MPATTSYSSSAPAAGTHAQFADAWMWRSIQYAPLFVSSGSAASPARSKGDQRDAAVPAKDSSPRRM
ncbi:hypothetical protein AURDEDRAFT_112792 [Auricularia subglabra TFB-10046 SS5]|nr:hypothetical protein AURDEDRAFT_112792 [Auricularia subglabra TFB-10046 SS5]